MTFADGTTYAISKVSGTTITLESGLKTAESAGTAAYGRQEAPDRLRVDGGWTGCDIGEAQRGRHSASPLHQRGDRGRFVHHRGRCRQFQWLFPYRKRRAWTSPSPLVPRSTTAVPPADVSVEYLDISHDLHNTTGTIYTGAGWTITHNDIHDGYSTPGFGVAIYGGDQGTIEYNCLSKMGDYGVNLFGSNSHFDYNEIYESNYEPDPGAAAPAGEMVGTLNADIVDNAFVDDSPGGGNPRWLDNGNSGTLISGNYFYMSYGSAITSETGFDLDVTGNLFLDGGWEAAKAGAGITATAR